MENFIVRIYHRDSRDIAGLVERVEMNEQHPFACFDELRDILAIRPAKARKPGGLQDGNSINRLRGGNHVTR